MTKNELVDEAITMSGFRKKDVEVMADAVLNCIRGALRRGENVELRGFGTFKSKEVAARTARNPKTGESVEVPAHRKVSFKAGKDLV